MESRHKMIDAAYGGLARIELEIPLCIFGMPLLQVPYTPYNYGSGQVYRKVI